jgi:hypothetical protein
VKVEVFQNGTLVESRDFNEGSYKIGRAPECDIRLKSPQISKQHALLVIKGDKAAIVDLGSSNGVFVNGILVRKQRVEPGDDITIVDFKIKIAPPGRPDRGVVRNIAEGGGSFRSQQPDNLQIDFGGSAAPDLSAFQQPMQEEPQLAIAEKTSQEKLLELMDTKILVPFFGIVKTVDWRWILASILMSSLIASVILSVIPIVRWGKKITSKEAVERAQTVVAQTVRENYRILAKTGDFTGLTVEAADNEPGMIGVYIIDAKTRQILAPAKYYNKSLTDSWSLAAVEKILKGGDKVDRAQVERDDGTFVLAQPIKLAPTEQNLTNIVAIVIANFEVASEITTTFEPLVEASLFAVLMSLVAFFFIYKMITFPVIQMNEQLDAALKGESVQITCEAQFPELESLATQMNFTVGRLNKETGGGGPVNGDDSEEEEADYVRSIRELDEGTSDGLILLDRDKRVKFVGAILGELVGLRQQYAEGQNIGDACKDSGLAGTCIDLTESVLGSLGATQTAQLDINGISRNLVAIARKMRNGEIKFVLIIVKLTGGGE